MRCVALVAAAVVVPANLGAAPANQILRLAGELQICATPDPRQPSSAFDIARSAADADGDYWVAYRCNVPCADWQDCQVPLAGDTAKQAVAFVVDGMGGHLAFSTRQEGDKTVLLHTGVGGTYYMNSLARQIEDASSAKVVMVRWERGFSGWGWFTRTSAPATRVPNATRRIASVIAWTHENLAGSADFGTVGCSMGTQATLGAVYYHDVDAVVDYQLMVGGPGLWDINSGCARRTYPTGYCDVDATRACGSDADCAVLSPRSRCSKPGPIPLARLYEQVVNHVHATQACDVATADGAATTIPAFDESSFAFVEGDWDFDHPIDFQMDLWGRDGDHRWAMADAMRVFNSIGSAAGYPKRWYTTPDSNHCAAIGNGRALELLTAGMGLGDAVAPLRPNPILDPGATTTVDLTRLFAGGRALTFEAVSDTPDLVSAQVDGGTLVLTATTEDADGSATITVRASNSSGTTASATFTVTVEFTPRPFLRSWRTALTAEGDGG